MPKSLRAAVPWGRRDCVAKVFRLEGFSSADLKNPMVRRCRELKISIENKIMKVKEIPTLCRAPQTVSCNQRTF